MPFWFTAIKDAMKIYPRSIRPKFVIGQCVPWTKRPLDSASHRQCVPWSVRPLEDTPLGQHVSGTVRPLNKTSLKAASLDLGQKHRKENHFIRVGSRDTSFRDVSFTGSIVRERRLPVHRPRTNVRGHNGQGQINIAPEEPNIRVWNLLIISRIRSH
jgi:hypothetical protein